MPSACFAASSTTRCVLLAVGAVLGVLLLRLPRAAVCQTARSRAPLSLPFTPTHPQMLLQIERYLKQAVVDKSAVVASAVLAGALHLVAGGNGEVIKRWNNEIAEAINSRHPMVQVRARRGQRCGVRRRRRWTRCRCRGCLPPCAPPAPDAPLLLSTRAPCRSSTQ